MSVILATALVRKICKAARVIQIGKGSQR